MSTPEVKETKTVYKGRVTTISSDTLTIDDGKPFVREVAVVTDSVAVVAIDSQSRILLICQYRHPMKKFVWEIPAGRVDVEGEQPHDAALRELREETDTTASKIDQLTVFGNSVGWTTERTYLYIAHNLQDVTEYSRHNEEAGIRKEWLPLVDAVGKVQSGEIDDAKTIIGILLADSFVRQQPNQS